MSKKAQLKVLEIETKNFIEKHGYKVPNSKYAVVNFIQAAILGAKMRINFVIHGAFESYKEMYLLELKAFSVLWPI